MSQTEKIMELPLEEVLGDRFGRYSKYIIQERALPDARDGLKPVQRRILYAMLRDGNVNDKPFRKAAKTVGNVIGNYHPHGDSSVYEAMVRMSQTWKVRNVLIEMHGNNGSIDGDPPAAMRYTEARLSAIAAELLRDIDKETVEFTPNFDDTSEEPVVLPSMFPNLLVNGSTGISAGYATDIPPHHLGEVIDAVVKRIDNPMITVEELMKVIKGPDFPTGGIIQGIDGIEKAYKTGKGRIVVRGKAQIETLRGGKEQIIIEEIPYDVNKANLVKKIDELRLDRKLEGISEVRDETDRTGLRIVIELKKDADATGVLNYLYKNTDLQVSYNFNMVAIHNKTPKLMGLIDILDAYIAHQKEVVTNRSNYELRKASERQHIVEGLMKAISVLDEVIATIRASKDKRDSKDQLMKKFDFTEPQSEAIVTLQLYRLTNTDITALQAEYSELQKKIEELTSILSSEAKLFSVIKTDLLKMKKTYADPRRTQIENEIEEIKINLEVMIPSEDVIVTVTKDGYVKRTSIRSYTASGVNEFGMKENDYLIGKFEINTTNTLLLFTSKGNFLYIPVHELPDIRWKDLGQHITNIIPISQDEFIIKAMPVQDFNSNEYLIFFSKNGMVKKTPIIEYKAQRYSKPLVAINLKGDDKVIDVLSSPGGKNVFVATKKGYGLWYEEDEISIVGQRAAGVKAINLKEDDEVVSGILFDDENSSELLLITHRGAAKKMAFTEFEKTTRAKRGLIMLRELKANPHQVVKMVLLNKNEDKKVTLITAKNESKEIDIMHVNRTDRYSNGSFVIDTDQRGYVINVLSD